MSYIGNLDTHRGLIGKLGEDAASEYLVSIGHSIIERNYRIKFGEIDIITRIGTTLHIIEVKTTQSTATTPEEHIDSRKILKMKSLANLYFHGYLSKLENAGIDTENICISLDFIGVVLNKDKTVKSINYLESLEV
jgi:putative endonuclease